AYQPDSGVSETAHPPGEGWAEEGEEQEAVGVHHDLGCVRPVRPSTAQPGAGGARPEADTGVGRGQPAAPQEDLDAGKARPDRPADGPAQPPGDGPAGQGRAEAPPPLPRPPRPR